MNLVAYDPWNVVGGLHRNLNHWFDRPFTASSAAGSHAGPRFTWTPAVDIKEDDDRFVIEADVPGMAPADLEITVENNVLSLSGTREYESKSDSAESGGFHRRERVRGHFVRHFTLPENADAGAVSAAGNNGVLIIEIGKKQEVKRKRIPVE
ncbi:MAG: Hsp20 family protein [Gammaproteobacteria bacterium]|nr:Hsp20 family protein [Gammaproteobacteria bacterium]